MYSEDLAVKAASILRQAYREGFEAAQRHGVKRLEAIAAVRPRSVTKDEIIRMAANAAKRLSEDKP